MADLAELDAQRPVVRQIHRVAHVGGRRRALVQRGPAQMQRFAAAQRAAGLQVVDHQIGELHLHRHAGGVVGFVGLVDVAVGVGGHFEAPCAGGQRGHVEADAAGVALRRQHALVAGGIRQVDPVVGVQRIHQAQALDEVGVGAVVAQVGHCVVDRHRVAHPPGGGRTDALHHQVRARFRLHVDRRRRGRQIIRGVAEFVDLAVDVGLDDQVHRPADVGRQPHVHAGVVGGADVECAHVGDRAEQRGAGERRRRRQIDLVGPAVDVCRHRAAVEHMPFEMGDPVGEQLGGRQRQGRHQIREGLRDGHAAGDAKVVGSRVGLAHGAVDVADHRDAVGALQPRRDAHRGALLITRAHVQRAAVCHAGQHHVVGVADDAVLAQHDAVYPRTVDTHRGDRPVVGNRPTHQGLRTGLDAGRHRQAGHCQVGVLAHAGAEGAAGIVVRLGIAGRIGLEQDPATDGRAVGADQHVELPGAQGAVGQHEVQRTGACFARYQRLGGIAREGHRGVEDDGARRAVGIAPADHDAVLVGHRGGHAALIDVLPHQGRRVARLRVALQQRDVARDQIRAHFQRQVGDVVGLERAAGAVLGDLGQHVQAHAQAELADRIQPGRPGDLGRTSGRAAGGQGLCRQRQVDAGHDHVGGLVEQLDPFGPRAAGGSAAGIAGGPLNRHRITRLPVGGRTDAQVADLQVGVGRQRAAESAEAAVVFFRRATLGLGVVGVGLDRHREVAGALRSVGQAQLHAARDRLAGLQRPVAGGRFHVGQHDLRHHFSGAGTAHDDTVAEVAARDADALVERGPGHVDQAARLNGGVGRGADRHVAHHQVHRRGGGVEVDDPRLAGFVDKHRQPEACAGVVGVGVVDEDAVAARDRSHALKVAQVARRQHAAVGVDQSNVAGVVVVVVADLGVVGVEARRQIAKVHEQVVTGLGIDAVGQHRTAAVDLPVHHLCVLQRRGRRHVEQAEGIRVGIERAVVDCQRVGAGRQMEHRQVGRIVAGREVVAAVGRLPVRAAQAPGEVVVVGAGAGVQAVELDRLVVGQREGVGARLHLGIQGAGDGLPQAQRQHLRRRQVVDLERHAAPSPAVAVRVVEHQVDRAVGADVDRCRIDVAGLPVRQGLPEGVDEPHHRRRAGDAQGVEAQRIAGRGVDAVQARRVHRSRRTGHRLAIAQLGGCARIEAAPVEVVAGVVVVVAQGQRVDARRQPHRRIPAGRLDDAQSVGHRHAGVVVRLPIVDRIAVQVPQAGLRHLEREGLRAAGSQRAGGRQGRGHRDDRLHRAPGGAERIGIRRHLGEAVAQHAQQVDAAAAQIDIQRPRSGVPVRDQATLLVEQLDVAAAIPGVGTQVQVIVGSDRQRPEAHRVGAVGLAQRSRDGRLGVELLLRRHAGGREMQGVGRAIGLIGQAQRVVAGVQVDRTRLPVRIRIEVFGPRGRAVGRHDLHQRIAGAHREAAQFDPARAGHVEAEVVDVVAGAQLRGAGSVPGQGRAGLDRLAQRGLEVIVLRRRVVLLGHHVERAGVRGDETDRTARGPVRTGDGAPLAVDQRVAEVVGVIDRGGEVEVVAVPGLDVEAVGHQGAPGRQVARQLGGLPVHDRRVLQAQQLEAEGRRFGVVLRRDVEAVGARHQAPHVVTLDTVQRQVQLDAVGAAERQVGRPTLRIEQDGGVLRQRERVVVDVADRRGAGADLVAEMDGRDRLVVRAQRQRRRAGAARIGVAVGVDDVAAAVGQLDAARVVVDVVAVAAGQHVAVRPDEHPIAVGGVAAAGAGVDDDALPGRGVELPGPAPGALAGGAVHRLAQRQARQRGHVLQHEAVRARTRLQRAQHHLVGAGRQAGDLVDVAVADAPVHQRTAGHVDSSQRRLIVVARDVQPGHGVLGQGEAVVHLVLGVDQSAGDVAAGRVVDLRDLCLRERDPARAGEAAPIVPRAHHDGVGARLVGDQLHARGAGPPAAADGAVQHQSALRVEDLEAADLRIAQGRGGAEPVVLPGLQAELQNRVGQAVAEHDVGAGRWVQRLDGATGVQGSAEGVGSTRRGVVVSALHAHRVAPGCQRVDGTAVG